eukprot:scaffold45016_cov45-Phaeocystis_antarctica.AAC.1
MRRANQEILTGWATRAGPPAIWPPTFRHPPVHYSLDRPRAAEYSPLTISFRFAIGAMATMRDNVVRQAFTVDGCLFQTRAFGPCEAVVRRLVVDVGDPVKAFKGGGGEGDDEGGSGEG